MLRGQVNHFPGDRHPGCGMAGKTFAREKLDFRNGAEQNEISN